MKGEEALRLLGPSLWAQVTGLLLYMQMWVILLLAFSATP